MGVLSDMWQAIVAVVAGADAITLALIVVLAAAAAFAMDRVHSFTGVTVAALLGFGLAKFALALSCHRTVALDDVAAALWRDFTALPMLTFSAYVLIFAALIGAVAALRRLLRR